MSKKLQKGSQYEKFDLDGDGIVSDQELKRSEHMIRLENSDKCKINNVCFVGYHLYHQSF